MGLLPGWLTLQVSICSGFWDPNSGEGQLHGPRAARMALHCPCGLWPVFCI